MARADLRAADAAPVDARGAETSSGDRRQPDASPSDGPIPSPDASDGTADASGTDGMLSPDRPPPDAAADGQPSDSAPVDVPAADAALADAWLPDAGECEGLGLPVPRYDPGAGCPEGSFQLGGGRCSAHWDCGPRWVRASSGYGCEPLPEAECPEGSVALPGGGCSSVWTCPAGWHRGGVAMTHDGCEPSPPDDCEPRQVPELAGGCHDLGLSACGEGPFGDHDFPGGTVFVDPVAPADTADGSQAHPFPSLDDALAMVGAIGGGHVALAEGEYFGFGVRGSLGLWGRCADRVRIHGLQTVAGASLDARDLAVVGPTPETGAGAFAEGGEMRLTRVRFGPGLDFALLAAGAGVVVAQDVLIESPARVGAAVLDGGTMSLTDAVVRGAGGVGLSAGSGRLDATRVLVAETGTLAGRRSFGVSAWEGVLSLTDTLVQDNHTSAAMVNTAGTLNAVRTVFRRSRFDPW